MFNQWNGCWENADRQTSGNTRCSPDSRAKKICCDDRPIKGIISRCLSAVTVPARGIGFTIEERSRRNVNYEVNLITLNLSVTPPVNKYIHTYIHAIWLILHYSKSMGKSGPHLPTLVTHIIWVIDLKFSAHHKYDVLSSISQKLEWVMHMGHKYESFKRCYEIEIYRLLFLNFCVGGKVKFQKFWSD